MSDETAVGPAQTVARSGALLDRFGRTKKKLRLSLTDRCNFRCIYCMPDHPGWRPKPELLSFEELYTLAGAFVRWFGVDQIRLTGGEPLARRDTQRFVAMLHGLRPVGLRRVSLSTNGAFLGRDAQELADAGLDDVNVSLDSLSPPRFASLTGGGSLGEVLDGIEAARGVGLPLKLNAVVIRGRNEGDIIPLARFGYAAKLPLRLIEFMPLDGRGLWSPDKVFSEKEIVATLEREFEVQRMPRTREPATYYLLNGTYPLGIISTVSNPFCAQCDRIRLTADGHLFACLFSPAGIDLRQPLRAGEGRATLERRIRNAIWNKPGGFVERSADSARAVSMHVLGG
ncbi:MAG TPA: GTP 3',8-cyclase MoaA [Pseudomonadota bacterium]|nr:GTP 3',8-cyclase MoaA [Pseudomonadota bacterium]